MTSRFSNLESKKLCEGWWKEFICETLREEECKRLIAQAYADRDAGRIHDGVHRNHVRAERAKAASAVGK